MIPTTLQHEDYRLIARRLERYARSFQISPEDAEELVADILVESLSPNRAASRGHVRQPGAYLFTTTRNRAFDRLRRARQHPVEPLDDANPEHATGGRFSKDDDAIIRLLEKHATADMIEGAMSAAAAAHDGMLVRVVGTWLNLAKQSGKEPSTREVADEAETSHTTVLNALKRLKAYLPPDP